MLTTKVKKMLLNSHSTLCYCLLRRDALIQNKLLRLYISSIEAFRSYFSSTDAHHVCRGQNQNKCCSACILPVDAFRRSRPASKAKQITVMRCCNSMSKIKINPCKLTFCRQELLITQLIKQNINTST